MNTYTHISSTTAAVTNRFVTSVTMKVGAYTLANTTSAAGGGFLVTVGHTTNGGADTLGTIVVVGTTLAGQTATDTITPVAGTTATGTVMFKKLTSVTGAGWVSDGTDDNIVVGSAAGAYCCGTGGVLETIVVNTTAAAAVTVSDAAGTIATLKASIAENTYEYDVVFSGYLKVATTSTNDLTIIHSATVPTYATA